MKILNDLRAEIATLELQRETLRQFTRSRSEVAASVQAHFDELVAVATREVDLYLTRLSVGGIAFAHLTDLEAVLTQAAAAKATVAFVLARLDGVPKGLDTPARLARLAEIETTLYDLEVQEEAQIDRIELATGQHVPRRPDARIEIVLALTAEV